MAIDEDNRPESKFPSPLSSSLVPAVAKGAGARGSQVPKGAECTKVMQVPEPRPATAQCVGLHLQPGHALQGPTHRGGTGQHTLPSAGILGCHRGLPARKRPLNWAVACWTAEQHLASACKGLCVLVGNIFSQSWGTRGPLRCKPCSEQPRTPGKNENGSAGPSASPHRAHRAQRDGGLAHLS